MRVSITIHRTWPLILAIMLPGPASAAVSSIRLTEGERPQVVVEGLPAAALAALSDARLDRTAWEAVFAIHVANDNAQSLPAMLGDYRVAGAKLIFTPRFPLKPGLSYRAAFNPAAIPGKPLRGERVETRLLIPTSRGGGATVVQAVYPSTSVLPENQLKFYLHFSAPMSRGDSYRHVRLLDAAGKPVDAPFLELAEELWDDRGRRLTLLLDPGRVKRDLKPHEEVGRAIFDGGRYTLVIGGDWRDAGGRPLGITFRKEFRVTKADVDQPDPKRWRLTLPAAGTRQPLLVDVAEPLDHAMLQHALRVSNRAEEVVTGRVTIDQEETRWRFEPTAPWSAGQYRMLVDANLEDLAGNSIARPFEVYLPAGRPAEIDDCIVPFQIGADPIRAEAPGKPH